MASTMAALWIGQTDGSRPRFTNGFDKIETKNEIEKENGDNGRNRGQWRAKEGGKWGTGEEVRTEQPIREEQRKLGKK